MVGAGAADRRLARRARRVSEERFDPLALEVMAHAFAAIAEEAGTVLVRGALSPNIRERHDSSAALFDADGKMVAQAAHIPVHLGAMPEAVRAVMERAPMSGDTYILNDPYRGGSHLPDLTLVHAVQHNGVIGAFVAVRAHHGDVGGMSPGSMPQGAVELVQEGLVLPPTRLARGDAIESEVLELILANVRTPDERRGDLRAQLGACAAGAAAWRALVQREGLVRVNAAGVALLSYTERRTTAALAALGTVEGRAEDVLEGDGVSDDDIVVQARVRVRDGRLEVDFTGSASAVRGNVNCPLAVTRAACVFVMRTLLDEDVPTNDGIAQALTIVAEPGSVVHAQWPSAVAAGNVEMSQRLADLVASALGDAGVPVHAQGQGTMNNVAFGGEGWTFYETLGGGQGGGPRGAGPSAVHVGMSNTRNTPIESLETALPLRVERYAVRRGSGGGGLHPGGDGVVRAYRALEPCMVTLLTERRRHGPRGLAGGAAGAIGRNTLNGEPLAAKCRVRLAAGDVLAIETPGGGGWGMNRT
jgi:N-methylhydantoinase B